MKPGLHEKAVAVVAEGDPAVAAAVAATAVVVAEDDPVVAVAVAAGAEAGTVTAAIAAEAAVAIAAGSSRKQSKVARIPGSLEALRFCFAKHPS